MCSECILSRAVTNIGGGYSVVTAHVMEEAFWTIEVQCLLPKPWPCSRSFLLVESFRIYNISQPSVDPGVLRLDRVSRKWNATDFAVASGHDGDSTWQG